MTAPLDVYQPPARTHTGQATQIEQARAQAEVLAAMEAAKRWPRNEDLAETKMRRACGRPLVAETAFWAFPRSGEQLTGPTIHLATTLAAIWGNMQYGVVELERSSARQESQMLAVAWELESNTRATTTFLVPHVRDTKKGPKPLTDLRDVYENNANQGARRVREMIFKILPDWYTETAQDICRATLEKSDKPIEVQREQLAAAFAGLGVTVDQLVAKIGREWDQTTPGDLAILKIVGKSIRRGEATVGEQFPSPGAPTRGDDPAVTVDELTGGRSATTAPQPPTEGPSSSEPIDVRAEQVTDAPPADDTEPSVGDDVPARRDLAKGVKAPGTQLRRLHKLIRDGEVIRRDDRLELAGFLIGEHVDSFDTLNVDQATRAIDGLLALQDDTGDYPAAVAAYVRMWRERRAELDQAAQPDPEPDPRDENPGPDDPGPE